MNAEAEFSQRVAQRYLERGYQVSTEVEILGHRVDMLAQRDGERRIVELLYSARSVPSERRQAIVDWLAESPLHHLDVVVGEATSVVEVIEHDEVARRIEGCRALIASENLDAALLMAWATFESAARRRVFLTLGYLLPRADLLSTVGRYGLLDPDEVDVLRETQGLRNAIAHGLFQSVTRERVERLLTFAKRLLDETPEVRDSAA